MFRPQSVMLTAPELHPGLTGHTSRSCVHKELLHGPRTHCQCLGVSHSQVYTYVHYNTFRSVQYFYTIQVNKYVATKCWWCFQCFMRHSALKEFSNADWCFSKLHQTWLCHPSTLERVPESAVSTWSTLELQLTSTQVSAPFHHINPEYRVSCQLHCKLPSITVIVIFCWWCKMCYGGRRRD